jgi:hypothetical protein
MNYQKKTKNAMKAICVQYLFGLKTNKIEMVFNDKELFSKTFLLLNVTLSI